MGYDVWHRARTTCDGLLYIMLFSKRWHHSRAQHGSPESLVSSDTEMGEDGGGEYPTSELRALVSMPTASLRSIRRVLVPSLPASWRAIDRPTAPPPMTWFLVRSCALMDIF